MADKFERLSYTKDWNNASDFPTYEENEAQVRADMQALHDEVKAFINEKLIPGIEGLAVPGTGDMLTAVFDPDGMMQDIFAYARAQAAAAVGTAKSNTATAITEYDTTQAAKFDEVDVRFKAVDNEMEQVIHKDTYGWKRYIPEYGDYEISSENMRTRGEVSVVTYAAEITSTGTTVTLVNPTTVTLYEGMTNFIPAKSFFLLGEATSASTCYYAKTATGSCGSYYDSFEVDAEGYLVTPHAVVAEFVDLVVSKNSDTYPHNAEQDGYYYEFMGKVLESFASNSVRMQILSYTGTGTYGASNQCSLTFDFVPQFVLITGHSSYQGMWIKGGSLMVSGTANAVTLNGRIFNWYNAVSAELQLNYSGAKYTVIGFG